MADLNQVEFFSDFEFPNREFEVDCAHQGLFTNLDTFRKILGERVHPSPVPGALTRFEGSKTSRHYCQIGNEKQEEFCDLFFSFVENKQKLNEILLENGIDKYSTAIDVFVEGDFYRAWQMATMSGLFRGVGVYPYTYFNDQRWPMLHLDIRPGVFTTIWARAKNEVYIYPLKEQGLRNEFLDELMEAVDTAKSINYGI